MMRFDHTTRFLHLYMMLAVLMQQFSSQWMKVPKPGETAQAIESVFLSVHEWNGFITLAIVVFYLMYITNDSDDWKRLFPWANASGCRGLWQEVRFDVPGWLKGRLKGPAESHHIAGFVHGLGVLLMIALGSTGIMIFMRLKSSGEANEELRMLRNLHASLGTCMWIYIFAHAGMAIMHQIKGHDVFRAIFSLKADDS